MLFRLGDRLQLIRDYIYAGPGCTCYFDGAPISRLNREIIDEQIYNIYIALGIKTFV